MKNSKKKFKQLLSLLVVSATVTSAAPVNIFAETADEPQPYVIVLEEDTDEKLEEKLLKEHPETEELGDGVYSIQLTPSEKRSLKKNQDISSVEEEITLSALTNKTDEEELPEVDFDGTLDIDDIVWDENDYTPGELEDDPNADEDPYNREEEPEAYGWNIEMIRATDKDIPAQENENIKVAILDSGVAVTDDIDVEKWIDLTQEENSEQENIYFNDTTGHGTSTASIIGAKKTGSGMIGINPDAELYSVKVLDGENKSSLSRVVQGIYWAIEENMDIINMSFGTPVNSPALKRAVADAYEAGILLVAAAGNKGSKGVDYPAAYPQVVAVGSVNSDAKRSDFSATGNELEIMAPGEAILTTGILGGYSGVEGTSISAAHASGAASLLWSLNREKDSDYIRQLLNATAKQVGDTKDYGFGILDVKQAWDQYNSFEAVYIPNKPEYPAIPENEEEIETFDSNDIVVGTWSGTNHLNLVNEASKDYKFNSNYIKIMATAAKESDSLLPSATYREIHGAGNYIANTKYLFRVAMEFKKNTAYSNAFNVTNANEARANLEAAAKKYLTDKKITNNQERCWAILGIASHIIGDTYAHRTRLPKASVDAEYNARFGGKENRFHKTKNSKAHSSSSYIANLREQLADGKRHFRQSRGYKTNCTDCYCTSTAANHKKCSYGITHAKKTSGGAEIGTSSLPCDKCKNAKDHTDSHRAKARCWCFDCFKDGTRNLSMEFIDMKLFQPNIDMNPGTGKLTFNSSMNFEDDPDFYSSRYTKATKWAVNRLLKQVNEGKDFTTHIYLPDDYNLKLNNLTNYILHTKTKWGDMNDSTKKRINELSTERYI